MHVRRATCFAMLLYAPTLVACSRWVELKLRLTRKVPEQINRVCLQVASEGRFVYAGRHSLREGQDPTLTIVAGANEQGAFDVLVRAEHDGLLGHEARQTLPFGPARAANAEIFIGPQDQGLPTERCGPRRGSGNFGPPANMSNRKDAVVATMPVAHSFSQLVVIGSGAAERLTWGVYGSTGVPQMLREERPVLPPFGTGPVHRAISVDLERDEASGVCSQDLVLLHEGGPTIWSHGERGAFEPRNVTLPFRREFLTGVAADFDGDGDADLALGSPASLVLIDNQGTQLADVSTRIPETRDVQSLATGLLDAGSTPDLLVGSSTSKPPALQVLLNQGARFVRAPTELPRQPKGPIWALAVADLNRDGFDDIVAAGDEELVIYQRDGTGTYARVDDVLPAGVASRGIRDLVVLDLNNDCLPDIVLLRPDGITVLIHDTPRDRARIGPYRLGTVAEPFGGTTLAVGDVDGDGLRDLMIGGAAGARLHRQVAVTP